MLRLSISAALVAALAVPAAAAPWKIVGRAPRNMHLVELDGGDGHDLVAAANQVNPDRGEQAPETGPPASWALRLVKGAWRKTQLTSGARHADQVIGVWWLGDLEVTSIFNAHGYTGLLETSRDGKTWATPDDTIIMDRFPLRVAGAVAVAASHQQIVRTLDGGATWTATDFAMTCGTDPCAPNGLVTAGGGHLVAIVPGGVEASDDDGDHWRQLAPAIAGVDMATASLVGDGTDDDALYVVGEKLAASSDHGKTWTSHDWPAGADGGSLIAAGASTLYLGGDHVWRSDDAGATWQDEKLAAGTYAALHVTAKRIYVVRFSDKGDEVLARALK